MQAARAERGARRPDQPKVGGVEWPLVDEAAVLKAQAFLLFYERLDGDMHMV